MSTGLGPDEMMLNWSLISLNSSSTTGVPLMILYGTFSCFCCKGFFVEITVFFIELRSSAFIFEIWSLICPLNMIRLSNSRSCASLIIPSISLRLLGSISMLNGCTLTDSYCLLFFNLNLEPSCWVLTADYWHSLRSSFYRVICTFRYSFLYSLLSNSC